MNAVPAAGMIAWSVFLAIIAQALCGFEMRRIARKEGTTHTGALIRWLDIAIVSLSSLLVQVSMMHAPQPIMLTGAVFGAFIAAAAWSDAQTGWVPDFVIIPSLLAGGICSWYWHTGLSPDLVTALLLLLGGLLVFGILIAAFIFLPFVRVTPPDAVFALLIVMTASDIPQMLIVLMALMLCLLLVKKRPQWVRALIPHEERARLAKQMDEALGEEDGHMEKGGWYPLGPIALVCVLTGVCANALL